MTTSGDRSAGRPAYVASDLLWTGGDDWQRRPFSARRKRLEATLRDGDRCVVSHALLGEGTLLAEALARFGLAAISARRLDARYTRFFDMRSGRVSLFAEAYNLLDIHNRRGYETGVSVDGQRRVTFPQEGVDWIPRLPTFGITYEFGGARR